MLDALTSTMLEPAFGVCCAEVRLLSILALHPASEQAALGTTLALFYSIRKLRSASVRAAPGRSLSLPLIVGFFH